MAIAQNARDNHVRCRLCLSPIEQGAKICPACKSYQNSWRSGLTYVAGMTAFLTLLGTCVVYVVSTGVDITKKLTWKDDIQISYLRYPEMSMFVNAGDGDAYIKMLQFYWGDYSQTVDVELAAEKGKFASFKKEPPPSDDDSTWYQGLNWYQNDSGTPSTALIAATDPTDDSSRRCLLPLFISSDNPDLKQINNAAVNMSQKVTLHPVKSQLYYVSGRTGSIIEKDIKGIHLAFLISDQDSCERKRVAWIGEIGRKPERARPLKQPTLPGNSR